MDDRGIISVMEDLVRFDPDVADRSEVGSFLRQLNRVTGWADHAKVRATRRLRDLNAAGESERPGEALMDESRNSGKEARATEERERVCTEFAGFEDALAQGQLSSDHLDSLAKLTKGLPEEVLCDVRAITGDLLASATNDWVSEFERSTKSRIEAIRNQHRPQDDATELERQQAASKMSTWVDTGSGMHKTLIELDPIRSASLHSAIGAQLAKLRAEAGTADVPFSQLQITALMNAVSAGPGTERVPEVVIHVDEQSLSDGRHDDTLCETVDGSAIPVSTAQRLCCEAVVSATLLDADGTTRHLTEELRTANRAQRRALAAMYSTCAHPSCSVGFSNCRMHHIVWWSRGGKTVLANLLPLCETHHHLVHEGGWGLTIDEARTVTWFRPDGSIWTTSHINRRPHTSTEREPDMPPNPPPSRHRAERIKPASTEWRQPTLC